MLLNGQNILNLDFINNVAMINGEDYCLDRNLDANRQNAFAQYGGPITFSRGSQGTIVDSTGRISYAPNNLLTYSESFEAASWTKAQVSVTANSTVAPDGTITADTLAETTANLGHVTITAATAVVAPYVFSVYLKKGLGATAPNWVQLYTGGVSAQYANFNLGTGVVGSVAAGSTAAITNAGNGWYRCTLTFTPASSGSVSAAIAFTNNTDTTTRGPAYAGLTTSDVFIWGAQLEQVTYQTTPRAYIPTTTAAYYGPRFDYDPVTLASNGLLIEEQRTNRILNSEDFTGAAWTATISGTSTRVNGNTSSLGFMTGVITATSAGGGLRQQLTGLTSSQVYTISFYMQSTSTGVTFALENGAAAYGTPVSMKFNPSTGVIGTTTGFTSVTSTPYRNGYLYRMIFPPAGGQLIANLEWRIVNNGDQITIGRPQFEAGSFATSYIPTAASTVTRSADVCTISGTNFSNWYNQNEGTVYINIVPFAPPPINNIRFLEISGASINDRNPLMFASSIGMVYTQYRVSASRATDQVLISSGTGIYSANANIKIATAYKQDDFASVVNNIIVGTASSGYTLSAANKITIGYAQSGSNEIYNGYIRSLQYYPIRLPNATLQALTT